MQQKIYTCAPRGKAWAVLKWRYMPNGSCADTILSFNNKYAAERAAEKLNKEWEDLNKN